MKIKIVHGGYGLHINGRVRLMRPGSPAFEIAPEEGARLIAAGLAEQADDAAFPAVATVGKAKPSETSESGAPAKSAPERGGTDAKKTFAEMTLPELKKIGAKLGVPYRVGMKKADYAALIIAETEAAHEDGDGPDAPDDDGEDIVDDL